MTPARRVGLWAELMAFWRTPVRAEGAALMRITLAAVMLIELLVGLAPRLDAYLGPDGLLPLSATDWWFAEAGRFTLLGGPSGAAGLQEWLPAGLAAAWSDWAAGPGSAKLLFGVWIVALLGMMFGVCTRTCTVVAWVLAVSFHHRIYWVTNGGDRLFRIGLFYLMFSRCGAAWSLDALWARRKPLTLPKAVQFSTGATGGLSAGAVRSTAIALAGKPPVAPTPPEGCDVRIPAWPLRLMQIQLCAMYFFSGMAKLIGGGDPAENDWLDGTAVYWVLNDLCLPRFPYEWLPLPMIAYRLATWGTVLIELLWVPLVLFRRTRPWALAAGAALHLGIWATMEIGAFSPVILCWYALFVRPETLARLPAEARSHAPRGNGSSPLRGRFGFGA